MCVVILNPSIFNIIVSDCFSLEVASLNSCYSYQVFPLIVVVFVNIIPALFDTSIEVIKDCCSLKVPSFFLASATVSVAMF